VPAQPMLHLLVKVAGAREGRGTTRQFLQPHGWEGAAGGQEGNFSNDMDGGGSTRPSQADDV